MRSAVQRDACPNNQASAAVMVDFSDIGGRAACPCLSPYESCLCRESVSAHLISCPLAADGWSLSRLILKEVNKALAHFWPGCKLTPGVELNKKVPRLCPAELRAKLSPTVGLNHQQSVRLKSPSLCSMGERSGT
ncbi:hypothetical protein TNCV_4792341 [Trichonephila clavipes]|nr:hypothetical protein TNCV_4792341 [Trichonephila clavipes]